MKGYDHGVGWEPSINQDSTCDGTAGGAPPYTDTGNHMVRCGYFNVLTWGKGLCTVDNL